MPVNQLLTKRTAVSGNVSDKPQAVWSFELLAVARFRTGQANDSNDVVSAVLATLIGAAAKRRVEPRSVDAGRGSGKKNASGSLDSEITSGRVNCSSSLRAGLKPSRADWKAKSVGEPCKV